MRPLTIEEKLVCGLSTLVGVCLILYCVVVAALDAAAAP